MSKKEDLTPGGLEIVKRKFAPIHGRWFVVVRTSSIDEEYSIEAIGGNTPMQLWETYTPTIREAADAIDLWDRAPHETALDEL